MNVVVGIEIPGYIPESELKMLQGEQWNEQ
jgi:hypothetical protein